jgi:hypothetical protein
MLSALCVFEITKNKRRKIWLNLFIGPMFLSVAEPDAMLQRLRKSMPP